MTKEEIKFQYLRVIQDNQSNIIQMEYGVEKRKDIEGILTDAKKIYEWIIKKE